MIDSLDQGGAERSLVEMVGGFTAAGIDVTIAVLRGGGVFTEAAVGAGASIVELGGFTGTGKRPRPTRMSGEVVSLQGRRGKGMPAHVRAVGEVIERRSAELVHTTLFEASIAGRTAAALRGVPSVTSVVNTPYGPDQLTGLRRSIGVRAAQALDIATARLVDRFHANASHVADTMSARLLVPRERFEVIPRGRDAARLGRRTPERRARVRATLGIDASTPVVLCAARHESLKGLDTAIEVVSRLLVDRPKLRLLIAGREGNQTQSLRRLISSAGAGDTVELLGHRDDVADLLAASDAFLLPSRREGLPGVLIEAMALEVPIVATDLPGVREVLGIGPGLLARPDDADRLGALLRKALGGEDASRSGQWDPAGATTDLRQRFEQHHTIEAVTSQMTDLYRRVHERHASRPHHRPGRPGR